MLSHRPPAEVELLCRGSRCHGREPFFLALGEAITGSALYQMKITIVDPLGSDDHDQREYVHATT